jgi:hypothetical protein
LDGRCGESVNPELNQGIALVLSGYAWCIYGNFGVNYLIGGSFFVRQAGWWLQSRSIGVYRRSSAAWFVFF